MGHSVQKRESLVSETGVHDLLFWQDTPSDLISPLQKKSIDNSKTQIKYTRDWMQGLVAIKQRLLPLPWPSRLQIPSAWSRSEVAGVEKAAINFWGEWNGHSIDRSWICVFEHFPCVFALPFLCRLIITLFHNPSRKIQDHLMNNPKVSPQRQMALYFVIPFW